MVKMISVDVRFPMLPLMLACLLGALFSVPAKRLLLVFASRSSAGATFLRRRNNAARAVGLPRSLPPLLCCYHTHTHRERAVYAALRSFLRRSNVRAVCVSCSLPPLLFSLKWLFMTIHVLTGSSISQLQLHSPGIASFLCCFCFLLGCVTLLLLFTLFSGVFFIILFEVSRRHQEVSAMR